MQKRSKLFKIFVLTVLAIAMFFVGFYMIAGKDSGTLPETEVSPTTSLTETEDLPDFFPLDFPRHENAKIISSWQTESVDSQGLSVLLETSDSVPEVAGYYKTMLAKNDWETKIVQEDKSSVIISFQKDNYSGPLGITISDSGATLVSVTIGIRK